MRIAVCSLVFLFATACATARGARGSVARPQESQAEAEDARARQTDVDFEASDAPWRRVRHGRPSPISPWVPPARPEPTGEVQSDYDGPGLGVIVGVTLAVTLVILIGAGIHAIRESGGIGIGM